MDISTTIICSSCGSTSIKDRNNHGLVTLEKEADGSITVNPMQVFPVKVYACQSCGNVDFRFNPNLQD